MGNLAWVVLLECLRQGDWASASALASVVSPLVQCHVCQEVHTWKDGAECCGLPLPRLMECYAEPWRIVEPGPSAAIDEEMCRLVLGPVVECGNCHAVYIEQMWQTLELVGRIDDRHEGGELLEQRNCVCGSTMTKELEP